MSSFSSETLHPRARSAPFPSPHVSSLTWVAADQRADGNRYHLFNRMVGSLRWEPVRSVRLGAQSVAGRVGPTACRCRHPFFGDLDVRRRAPQLLRAHRVRQNTAQIEACSVHELTTPTIRSVTLLQHCRRPTFHARRRVFAVEEPSLVNAQRTARTRTVPRHDFDSHVDPITCTATPLYARKPDNLHVGRVAQAHI